MVLFSLCLCVCVCVCPVGSLGTKQQTVYIAVVNASNVTANQTNLHPICQYFSANMPVCLANIALPNPIVCFFSWVRTKQQVFLPHLFFCEMSGWFGKKQ